MAASLRSENILSRIDIELARTVLSKAMANAQEGIRGDQQISRMLDKDIYIRYVMEEMGSPRLWRLALSEDRTEECLFVIQGYVVHRELPPVLNRKQIPKNPIFAKQGLTISGFGFEHFDSCIDSITRTHTAAASMLPEGMSVCDWQPSEYGGHPALTFTNRYFSRTCHAKGVDIVPFNTDIDPRAIMREITANPQSKLVHSDDNVVHYFKRDTRRSTTSSSERFFTINPRMIHIGDMVEVQFSIVAFPGSKGKAGILKPVLRSIAVLDCSVREKAMSSDVRITHTKRKRTFGYDDDSEAVDITTHKLARMTTEEEEDIHMVTDEPVDTREQQNDTH